MSDYVFKVGSSQVVGPQTPLKRISILSVLGEPLNVSEGSVTCRSVLQKDLAGDTSR